MDKAVNRGKSRRLSLWYVVATKPRQERVAKENLERQGFTTYLPTMTQNKRRRGAWVHVTEPLFPSYLFVLLAMGKDDPAPIRSTTGCIGLVRFGAALTPLPAAFIENLEALARVNTQSQALFKSGDKVKLITGPFAGLEAVYDMAKGEDRARVLLEVLGKVQRLTVDLDALDN